MIINLLQNLLEHGQNFHNITLRPCTPHEHWALGENARLNRTLEDTIVKQLYGKMHLNFKYWTYAYKDIGRHAIFNGSIHDGHHGTLAFEQWTGEKPDWQKISYVTLWVYSNDT